MDVFSPLTGGLFLKGLDDDDRLETLIRMLLLLLPLSSDVFDSLERDGNGDDILCAFAIGLSSPRAIGKNVQCRVSQTKCS